MSCQFALLAFVIGLSQTSGAEPGIVIISTKLNEDYSTMKTDFSILLHNATDEILKTKSFEDIKSILLNIESSNDKERKEAINQANDKGQLVSMIRENCFLTNLGVLKSFVKNFDMKDTEAKIKEFEVQRAKLYEETLALDFARKAIEDHPRGSQSEVSIFCFPVFYLHHTLLDYF